MKIKTQIKLFAGIIISVVIIYYSAKALGGLNPGIIFTEHINWGLAAVSAVIFASSNYVRALAYPLGIDRNLGYMTSFRIIGIGHASNMVLPLHAGEGLRLAFFPSSYSTMERTRLIIIPGVADFVVIIMFALLSVPFAGFKNPGLVHALNVISLVFFGGLFLFFVVAWCIPRLKAYVSKYLNIAMAKMCFWVFLSWLVMLISIWIGLLSFGFRAEESISMSFAVFAATNIINFVPASPGGIGLFEYAVVLGLGGLGVQTMAAKSAGLLLHLIQYAALLPLGTVLYLTGLKKNPLKDRKKSYNRAAGTGAILKK